VGSAGLAGEAGMSIGPGGASDGGVGGEGTSLPNGLTCQAGTDCASGRCIDGFCCDKACAGCNACSNALTGQDNGKCASVINGQDPHAACSASCSSDLTSKITSTCNGLGACGALQPVACNAQYCDGGQCIPKIPNNGGGCSTNTACNSGNCSTSPSAGTMCCAANSANCSQGCYNLSADANHCGTCVTVCGPNNSCRSSKCQCAGGAKLSCGSCPSWNFESNTTEGWGNDTNTSSSVTPVAKATPPGAPFSGSSYSLAVPTNLVGQGNPGATVAAITVPLCASASTSADVTGFSFYLYMDGPAYTAGKELAQMEAGGLAMSPISKQWVLVSTTFPTASASSLQLYFNPMAAWSGTIYIDQVQITQ
jgi:hypothetical protein